MESWVRAGVVGTFLCVVLQGWSDYRVEFPRQAMPATQSGESSQIKVVPSGKEDAPVITPPPLWQVVTPSLVSASLLFASVLIAFRKGNRSRGRKFDNPTPLAQATRTTFHSLSLSQKLLIRYIYTHPNTETAFLLPALNEMGFPPRVGADSLSKVLTTNLVSRNNLHTFRNSEVRHIVEALIELEPWPTVEALRNVNRETTEAVQLDCKNGCDALIAKTRDEELGKYLKEQQAHQVTTHALMNERGSVATLEADKTRLSGVIQNLKSQIEAKDLTYCKELRDRDETIADLSNKLSKSEPSEITSGVHRVSSSSHITVNRALWGIGGDDYKDVTGLVQGYVNSRTRWKAANEHLGDPYPGKPKHLRIWYTNSLDVFGEKTISYQEGADVLLV